MYNKTCFTILILVRRMGIRQFLVAYALTGVEFRQKLHVKLFPVVKYLQGVFVQFSCELLFGEALGRPDQLPGPILGFLESRFTVAVSTSRSAFSTFSKSIF